MTQHRGAAKLSHPSHGATILSSEPKGRTTSHHSNANLSSPRTSPKTPRWLLTTSHLAPSPSRKFHVPQWSRPLVTDAPPTPDFSLPSTNVPETGRRNDSSQSTLDITTQGAFRFKALTCTEARKSTSLSHMPQDPQSSHKKRKSRCPKTPLCDFWVPFYSLRPARLSCPTTPVRNEAQPF